MTTEYEIRQQAPGQGERRMVQPRVARAFFAVHDCLRAWMPAGTVAKSLDQQKSVPTPAAPARIGTGAVVAAIAAAPR